MHPNKIATIRTGIIFFVARKRINSATKSKTTRARIIRLTASLCRLPYLNIGTTENGMDELVYRKRLIKSLYIEKMVFMLFSNQNKDEDKDGKKIIKFAIKREEC